jgi:hypothetical protein
MFMPYKPLSVFAGLDPKGDWILNIYDAVENNEGLLNAWGLILYYEEASVNTNPEPTKQKAYGGAELYQKYPNPFHGQTYISSYLQENLDVEITVYDFLGKKVAALFKASQDPGNHQISWEASQYRSGIYILQLKAGSQYLYKKMILMK